MSTYIIRRILQFIPVLFLISLVSFILLINMPGDPIDMLMMSDPNITPEDIAALKKVYGLDQPFYLRYLRWIKRVLSGDLGFSRQYKLPVLEIIKRNLGNTVLLIGSSFIIALTFAIPIGIFSAVKQYSIWDYFWTVYAFFGFSMPSHWFGLLVIYLFAVKLGWLPPAGFRSVSVEPGLINLILDRIRYLILPAFTLGLISMAGWMRYMRSSMLEVIREDYIRTARSKGLSEKVVIYKHALRNALIPLITLIMLAIPGIFGGAIITEAVFAYPGMGRLFIHSINAHDTFITMAIVMFLAILTVIFNLIADICYALIDPRIRYS
ncbi:hypothetical protein BBF96_05710 [Anoxybacter fermentans]|uniref:ABC transmembrane type-1 domain-containing protein n=1 Tax=Anoxybacter fermentans TaxID=1323375 RepID=A0A3Q9HPW2_9FIRM|nr:ABC transporter permease [Anoxybacter fermentans]AZR72931.1 hypothetical protein BBF96_05710 [Anoxybacter fermentans]